MNGFLSVKNEPTKFWKIIVEYEAAIASTDIVDPHELRPIQHGLFGEVGGIMATAKKLVREKNAYPGYRKAAEEEFGDTLWYLAALCRRRTICLADLIHKAIIDTDSTARLVRTRSKVKTPHIEQPSDEMDRALVHLGRVAASMLDENPSSEHMQEFVHHYVSALTTANLSLADVVHANMRKVCGAFLDPTPEDLVDFDSDFGPDEQLPQNFKIRISQRPSGKSYLQWNGVFIGDPLTDNISDRDGYRFHDVFHLANAAILHWSPVMRALIKQKRKSKGKFDEEQDSGRAFVVEEGLTAWIFSRAKELDYFAGLTRVPLDILKTIQEFVVGYEVEQCPLKLWDHAILQGYDVFRQLKAAKGGIIIGDRGKRTLCFESMEIEK